MLTTTRSLSIRGTNHALLFVLLLLLLLTATAAALAYSKKQKMKSNDDIMSISKMTKLLFGSPEYEISDQSMAMSAPLTTELLVIGAGFGRTGTTSYMAALERLGLQSYHMKGVLGTPGHLDMWIEYLTEKKRQRLLINEGDGDDGKVRQQEQVDKIVHGLAAAGFDATASMPACLAFQDLMERYPKARVVVTIRGDGNGQAWATSILNSVALMLPAMQRIPFRWVGKLQRFSQLIPMMWDEIGAPINATTNLPERNEVAQAYDAWLEHVQSVAVPSNDKLLFFAAESGWQPLCDFLSPIHANIESACKEILALGEPYPRINETAQVQRLLKILGAISWTFEHAPYFVALVVLLVAIKIAQSSSTRRAASAGMVKKKKE